MPIHPPPRRVLCVAEKPSISKSITQILSEGQSQNTASAHKYVRNYTFPYKLPPNPNPVHFTVTSVLGHVNGTDFEEDKKKWSSCDPFELFDATIVSSPREDGIKVARNLSGLAKHHDLLMIWTDCDREGEHIGSEIASICRKSNPSIRILRARFSAIIPAQIHNAARNPVELNMLEAAAVDARISFDLRTGAALTRLFTTQLQNKFPELQKKIISYGSCQFPTLGFVVDRYSEVQDFKPEKFWYIFVSQEREGNSTVFNWRRGHLFDLETTVMLYEKCVESAMARVISVDKKDTTKYKPFPLTTVELQKSGSRLLRMSPKAILDHAEKLYQKGFLSYPRTETDQYDKDFDFETLIQKQTADPNWGSYAQGLLDGAYERPRNGQKNDKAHPPIHPTAWCGETHGDEKKVYEYVTRRFLASCSQSARGSTTTVAIDIADEEFTTSGLVIFARNYLDVFPYDKWSGHILPNFQVNEHFMPSVCELKEGLTTAPSLLTEADLVGIMDRNGIGTDATIATHIQTIIDREYVMQNIQGATKYLVPSTLGMALVEGSNNIGFDKSLCKPHMRRETEHRMQLIVDGIQTKNDVLQMSIDEYKEVFIKAKREFNKIVQAVAYHLQGQVDSNPAPPPVSARRQNGRGPPPAVRPDDSSDADSDGTGGQDGGINRGSASRARAGATNPRGRGDSAATRSTTSRSRRDTGADDEARGAGGGPSQCTCGLPVVQRTVIREGPNLGRMFFSCPKSQDESCKFFEWSDGSSTGRNTVAPKKSVPAKRTAGRDQPDDEKTCRCELPAVKRVTRKEGPNQGKEFWTCPNSEENRCGFFEWLDDDGRGERSKAATSRSNNNTRDEEGPKTGDCFKCGRSGHWSSNCPDGDSKGVRGSSRGGRGKRGGGRGGNRGRGSSRKSSASKSSYNNERY